MASDVETRTPENEGFGPSVTLGPRREVVTESLQPYFYGVDGVVNSPY